MSRCPVPSDSMLPLDFGPPAVVIAAALEPAIAPALERRRPSIFDPDQRIIEMWLHGKAIHTQRAYKRAAQHFLEFVNKPLRAVTLGDFQSFTDTLHGKASSRRQVITIIKALLSFGFRQGALPVNIGPALAEIKTPNMLADRILSEAEIARMLASSNGRDHLLVRLLYAGGLRVSELLGVKWANIAAAPDGTAYITVCGEGGKSRTVRVTQATTDLLLAHRAAATMDEYVFAGRDGALDPSQAWRIVRDIAKRAGLEKNVSPHFMRHSHATHAIDRGAKITTVRDTIGHFSIAVTDRYAHARPAESSGLSFGGLETPDIVPKLLKLMPADNTSRTAAL